MFRASVNQYDEPVAKTTDENLTGENWELILNLCDKVTDEGEAGARNVIAAVLKRLTHRNPNVQLYSLALAEALSKNCGLQVNREIASRSFTQGLERLVTDRTTHDKVKRRALALIQQWTGEFENDPTLGIMEECYENLKAKNYKFDQAVEAPPPVVDDAIRRKEEEELQRVLELSMQDKGGRDRWYTGGYTASASAGASGSRNASTSNLPGTSGAGAAASSSAAAASSSSSSKPAPSKAAPKAHHQAAPSYSSSSPAYTAPTPAVVQPKSPVAATQAPVIVATQTPSSPKAAGEQLVTRVRALHTFEPTELGELAFDKGDIIKVVDRQFKDWWRGQLKGKTGIFPVNYVEPLPEPTPAELAKEAQIEIDVFSQAGSIDRLLGMLRGLDPLKDNLSDNDELQELYRQSVSLRPKIVKLLDKYTQKRIELTSMNDNFKTARQMFETMMEESLAKHSPGVTYDYRQQPRPGYDAYGQPTQSVYGWNPVLQPGQQPPSGPYPGGYPPQQGATPAPYGPQDYVQPYGPAPTVDPHSAYAQQYQQYPQQQQQQGAPPASYQPDAQQQQQQPPQQQGYPGQEYQGYQGYPQQQQAVPGQQPYAQPPQGGPGPQQQQQYAQAQAQPQGQQGPPGQQQQPAGQQQPIPSQQQYAQPQQGAPAQQQPAQGQQPYGQPQQQQQQQQQQAQQPIPGQQQQPAPGQTQGYPVGPTPGGPQRQPSLQSPVPVAAVTLGQTQGSTDSGQTPQYHQEAVQQQQQQQPAASQPAPVAEVVAASAPAPEPQAQPQQAQPAAQQAQQAGPPYVWSPNGQYPDPGAQAWAQYYAQGGPDPAGRVYFTPESLPPLPGEGGTPGVALTSATPI